MIVETLLVTYIYIVFMSSIYLFKYWQKFNLIRHIHIPHHLISLVIVKINANSVYTQE